MTNKELVALTKRVVSTFTVSDWAVIATLLNVDDAVYGRERLLRSQRFNDEDYEYEVLVAVQKIVDADPGNYSRLLDYLDEKYPDSAEDITVSSVDGSGRRIVFSPQVFDVPTKLPDPKLISVMMPFGAATQAVYEAIKEAATTAGFACKRADDIWHSPTVIQDVFSLIYDSYIVVCDFSGKNTNVFYEAGIAHTLGKHVVPITQHLDDVPFDLRHHRHALYLNNVEGREKLAEELRARFRTLDESRE